LLIQAHPPFPLLECKASGTSSWVKWENRETEELASGSAQKEESAWYPSHQPRGLESWGAVSFGFRPHWQFFDGSAMERDVVAEWGVHIGGNRALPPT